MPIEFHCERCGKFIRTADEHGGKHGKCPSCHQRVYIPSGEIEVLDLAPVDEAAERRAQQAAQESARLADALLSESSPPAGGSPAGSAARSGTSGSPGAPGSPSLRGQSDRDAAGPARGVASGRSAAGPPAEEPAPISPAEVGDLVREYAISMFEGELEEAQQIATQLRRHPQEVNEAVQRIVADELPHSAIEHIPRPVLMGFLKQLRAGT